MGCSLGRAVPCIMRDAWMVKALYFLKIFFFKQQFKLTKQEQKGMEDVCFFIVLVYVKAWFTAPLPTSAPSNDLLFLRCQIRYKKTNPTLSKVACCKFGAHLWYSSEELAAMGFFDAAFSTTCKHAMVKAIKENDIVRVPPARIKLDLDKADDITISDFVTKYTMNFCTNLQIDISFLDSDP